VRRSVVSGLLIALLLCALVPVSLLSAEQGTAAPSCCKSGHACCRRGAHSQGPALAANSCACESCRCTLGGSSGVPGVGAGSGAGSYAPVFAARTLFGFSAPACSAFLDCSLLQRPPPSSC